MAKQRSTAGRSSQPDQLLKEARAALKRLERDVRVGNITQAGFDQGLQEIQGAVSSLDKARQGRFALDVQTANIQRRNPIRAELALRSAGQPARQALQRGRQQGIANVARSRRRTGTTQRLTRARQRITEAAGGVQVPGVFGSSAATENRRLQEPLRRLAAAATPRKVAQEGRGVLSAARGAKRAGGLVRGGAIGGAIALGLPLILSALSGSKETKGPDLNPEVQFQLMQALAARQGSQTDPALTTGRGLRNVVQLLNIIKTLQGLQSGLGQPQVGGLV